MRNRIHGTAFAAALAVVSLVHDLKPSGRRKTDEPVHCFCRKSRGFRQEAVLAKERVSFGPSVGDVGRIGIEVVLLGLELS
jgi:hypothetical protein